MAKIKPGWLKGIVDGVSTRLYAYSHAKLCYYGDPANGVTVEDKIDELNTDLKQANKILNLVSAIDAGSKSILSAALTSESLFATIITNVSTTDVPTGYNYGFGFVVRRSLDQLWILLFGYNKNKIAINCYTAGTWTGWSEK